ncbi:MAG: threonylcarbamoyl-AMP synthase [Paramuribaculum sp.]|nr:threonylcarbamoyl-AMP synthase [Paramuribaculum sp.]
MKVLKIYPTSINSRFVEEAVGELRDGGIILYPTDTLYALACSALNQSAIDRLCRVKGLNPQKEFLSIVCSDISQASEYARIDNAAFRILKNNLPGPFTFILPASTVLPKAFKGRKTVGVRVPDNPIATALAAELGHPLLTTSVSPDADSSPESVSEPDVVALNYSDKVALMIDGGRIAGVPSTIIDITDSSSPVLIREGAGILI